jgi:hypothetical protein
MKKTTNEIIAQIRVLLNKLEGVSAKVDSSTTEAVKVVAKKAAGCIGAIQGLIDEGLFESQKTVLQVVDKLNEEGQPYSKALVSMNLLNLVKRKVLRRIKQNDQWQYIIRK